jgi:hypothetical protein
VLAGRVADGYRRAGPPLGPNWDAAAWETAGTAARAVFYGAAGAMAPGPGFPPFGDGGGGTTMDPGERGGKGKPAGPMGPGPMDPGFGVDPPSGFTMDPGQRGQRTVAAQAALTKEEALGLLSGQFTGRFDGVTVYPGAKSEVVNNFNITGVTPDEVMASIGEFVGANGPMPDWWTTT